MRKLPTLPIAHLATVLLALATAASAAQWGLRLFGPGQGRTPAGAVEGITVAGLASGASSLFGAAPPAPGPAAPSYRLWGVIGGGAHAGAALIGRDSAPAQAFPVGAEIAPGVRLVDTGFGSAVLLQGGMRTTLRTPGAGTRGGIAPPPSASASSPPVGGEAPAATQASPRAESAAAEAAHMRELATH
ncbi:MAG: general secretion pathway protein GspC [Betaproteobacteria bacterium]|nr:general secretion pathway protein GspC [Betaproteobacteria bacterium]